MPSTYNGVGTWYYGKSDVTKRPGHCPYCGHSTKLESYNTTLFIVVLFIPIIPLGRKRIIDKCPECTKHQAAPLAAYQQARVTDIDAAVKGFCADPSEESAERALKAAIYYRAVDSFRGAATLAEQTLPEFAGVHYLIGSGHRFFGHQGDAEESFRRSLSLHFDPDCAEEYALLLLEANRPAEAEIQLKHMFDHPRLDKVHLVNYLADKYQVKGQHREALAALKHWAHRVPAANQNKIFKRLLARAEKYQNSTTPVKPLGTETSPVTVVVLVVVILLIILVIFLATR